MHTCPFIICKVVTMDVLKGEGCSDFCATPLTMITLYINMDRSGLTIAAFIYFFIVYITM